MLFRGERGIPARLCDGRNSVELSDAKRQAPDWYAPQPRVHHVARQTDLQKVVSTKKKHPLEE
jgi:hypothetical protein